jgi:hypothetical protein
VTVLAASQSVIDQPGTVAFLVVFGMGVMLFFVFRSMSRHLRKVNDAARAAQDATEAQESGEAQAQAVSEQGGSAG